MHRELSAEAVSPHKTLEACLFCHCASLMELPPFGNLDYPDIAGFLEKDEDLGFLLGSPGYVFAMKIAQFGPQFGFLN